MSPITIAERAACYALATAPTYAICADCFEGIGREGVACIECNGRGEVLVFDPAPEVLNALSPMASEPALVIHHAALTRAGTALATCGCEGEEHANLAEWEAVHGAAF